MEICRQKQTSDPSQDVLQSPGADWRPLESIRMSAAKRRRARGELDAVKFTRSPKGTVSLVFESQVAEVDFYFVLQIEISQISHRLIDHRPWFLFDRDRRCFRFSCRLTRFLGLPFSLGSCFRFYFLSSPSSLLRK